MSTASTIATDSTTKGSWVGNYGGLGYQIVGPTTKTSWPGGWSFSTTGTVFNKPALDAPDPDGFYLEPISPDTEAYGGCWYQGTAMSFTITPPDSGTYQLAFYDCYNESSGTVHRQYSIQILDDATSAVLQSLPLDYYYFQYVKFTFSGTIRVVLTGSEPVTTGFFLDESAAPSSPAPNASIMIGGF